MPDPVQPTPSAPAPDPASQPDHGKANEHPRHSLRRLLGPGIVAGAADDDPSGIATYSQAGAQFGFNQL